MSAAETEPRAVASGCVLRRAARVPTDRPARYRSRFCSRPAAVQAALNCNQLYYFGKDFIVR